MHMQKRIADEQKLWDAIPDVPDLQCAWQLLLRSAGPRCNHLLRTTPPEQASEYARRHDEGMWATAKRLLGLSSGVMQGEDMAHKIATLPMRQGGLGLRSAERLHEVAYWFSWADALPMIGAWELGIAAIG